MRGAGLQGKVHGGQQPIANAVVQIYAAGQSGVASPATPLLVKGARTQSDGSFSLDGLYTCPAASTPVYLIASGGNPGLHGGNNSAIALMAALGPCGSLGELKQVTLNEVTTVAAVFSLAPFMKSYASVGTDPTLAAQFADGWTQAAQLADVRTGIASGLEPLSAGPLATVDLSAKINSLANVLASCINSGGGSAGDGSLCGQLFAYTSTAGNVPADTAAAALQIARDPAHHAREMFALLGPLVPFEPQLPAAPENWGLLSSAGLSLATVAPVDPALPVSLPDPVVAPDPLPTAPVIDPPPVIVTGLAPIPLAVLTLSTPTLEKDRTGAGTVTLSSAAPAGGLPVTLASSAAGVLNLPQSVTVAAGQSSAKFFYTATAVGTTLVSAAATGLAGSSAPLSVQLPVAQARMFGLSVLDYNNIVPKLSYSTTRSWDAYPGLDWADANPAPGVYQFGPLNTFIALNQARGEDILYTFGRTPQWTSASPNTPGFYLTGQCGAPALSAWDAYVTAIVTTAAGRIKYWELWNEPDFAGTWCADIPTMVTMAQHAYRIIKSLDPGAKVLSPGTSGGDGASWLANFLNQGGKGTFDIVAFHGYEGTIAEAITPIVNVYRNAMRVFGIDELPLWDTECSWGNNPIGDDAHRAAFLAKYVVLQWSDGVERSLWYAYDGQPGWGRLIDDNNNLLPDGIAYAQVRNWLLGATLTQPCAQDSSGTWRCGISRPGGYSAQMLWNSNQTTGGVAIPGTITQFRDLSGTVTHFYGGNVSIGNMPLLFETGTF